MKQALRVAFGFLILWASVLHAEVRIVIDSGVDSGRPIGVVPFQWAGPGAAPEDIGGIVAAELIPALCFAAIFIFARFRSQTATN